MSAQMLDVVGLDGRWGRRLFINVQAEGRRIKLFGTKSQLAEHVRAAGFPEYADHLTEGVTLHVPCRVLTSPSRDGRYLNIDRVLPVRQGTAHSQSHAVPVPLPHQPVPALSGAVPALLRRAPEVKSPTGGSGLWPGPSRGPGRPVPGTGSDPVLSGSLADLPECRTPVRPLRFLGEAGLDG